MNFQKQVFFLNLGYFFNNAIICYRLKRPRFKWKAHTLYATHKLCFLTIMKHEFPKTSGFFLNLGYFFNNAIICYCLKRPRFKWKAHTLYATHKLCFLTIMKQEFPKTSVFFLNLGYFFNNAIICYRLKRPRFKRKAHTLYATHKLCFLTIMKHEFPKTSVFFLNLGYFFNNAIICYRLKRPRFKWKAHTLYATHKLCFLTIMKHEFQKNHLLLFEKASIQVKSTHFIRNPQIVFLDNNEAWISKNKCFFLNLGYFFNNAIICYRL